MLRFANPLQIQLFAANSSIKGWKGLHHGFEFGLHTLADIASQDCQNDSKQSREIIMIEGALADSLQSCPT
jgi:hypothetical protein